MYVVFGECCREHVGLCNNPKNWRLPTHPYSLQPATWQPATAQLAAVQPCNLQPCSLAASNLSIGMLRVRPGPTLQPVALQQAARKFPRQWTVDLCSMREATIFRAGPPSRRLRSRTPRGRTERYPKAPAVGMWDWSGLEGSERFHHGTQSSGQILLPSPRNA